MPLNRRAIVTALTALACASVTAQPLNPALFLPISASVVRVEAERVHGGVFVGSGVTVAPNVVATNCHVVQDASEVRIAGAGGTFSADAEQGDVHRDVCFLRVPGWVGKPVPLASSDAQPGASVVALGYTGGAAIAPRIGSVRALHEYDGGRVIESNAAFNSGSSGGGLFSGDGRLLGLLTFRLRNSNESYFTLPVDWIRAGLPRDGTWRSVRPFADAHPFWQGDPTSLPFFLRAAALENDGEWQQLLELIPVWASADPASAEPFRARGRALRELQRPAAAAQAYQAALKIEPNDAWSLYGLALASDGSGDRSSARDAEERLTAMDDDLSRALARKLASRGHLGVAQGR